MRYRFLFLFLLLVPAAAWAGKPFPYEDGDGFKTPGDGVDGVERTETGTEISLPLGLPLSYEKPTPSGTDNNYMGGVTPAPASGTAAGTKIIYRVDFRDDVGPPSWREAQAALRQARYMKADVILIHMNGFNGSLETADNIRRNLLEFDKPVMVYLDKPTTGAGTLISLAGDSIYMNPKSRIGSATLKDRSGRPAPGNYQRYMRSLLHHTAEATSHNPVAAEAMSNGKENRLLNASEARQNNLIEGQAGSVDDVLRLSGYDDYKVIRYTPGAWERLISLLLTPGMRFLLLCSMALCLFRFAFTSAGKGKMAVLHFMLAVPLFGALYEDARADFMEIGMYAAAATLLLFAPLLPVRLRRIVAFTLFAACVYLLSAASVETHAAFDPAALYTTGDLLETVLFTGSAFLLAGIIRWFAPVPRLAAFLRSNSNSGETIELFATVPSRSDHFPFGK